MNETNFTDNSYEQAIIALFGEMGYRFGRVGEASR